MTNGKWIYQILLKRHNQNKALYIIISMTKKNGIRTIYSKSGADSIPILDGMIDLIQRIYKQGDIWKDKAANALRPLYQLKTMAQLRPDGIWEGD